jgi:hypothetical protein
LHTPLPPRHAGDGSLYPVCNEDLCLKIEEIIGLCEDDGRDFRPCIYMGMRPQAYGYPDGFEKTEEGKLAAAVFCLLSCPLSVCCESAVGNARCGL